jgi:hypothetical protein
MNTNVRNVTQSNKTRKPILEYALWTMAALLLGIGYMYLILGPTPEETGILSFAFSKIRLFGLLLMGVAIGSILTTLFILLDVYYLKRKWKSSRHIFLIRTTAMLLILLILGALHYLLEKPLNVI